MSSGRDMPSDKNELITCLMKTHYDLDWLISCFETGAALEFIYFWRHTSKSNDILDQSCLSQWCGSPFTVRGTIYKTAEHWMMAQKALLFHDPSRYEEIIHCEATREAKALGRKVPYFHYDTWCDHRYEIAWLGNIHKFNQNPLLAEFLLNTDGKILAEASPTDRIWGVGLREDDPKIENLYIWPGQNLLGFVLMEVRYFLKSFGLFKAIKTSFPPPWISFPEIDPSDLFYRMGFGEDYFLKFHRYYYSLSERDRVIYKLTNPMPDEWKHFMGGYRADDNLKA
jgi:ribA/ribD-fused uncharacterized protein